MKINLRKAQNLQNQLRSEISETRICTDLQFTEFESAESQIEELRTNVFERIARLDRMTNTLYSIRASVGSANDSSGINNLLTKLNALQDQIRYYEDTVNSSERKKVNVIEARLAKMREADRDSILGGPHSGVLTSEDFDYLKRELSKLREKKQNIQDKVAELNIATTIDLETQDVELLSELGIIGFDD